MRLFSPAKINLFLRVIRKREDGFHDLASLFQAISLGDFLTFHFAEKDQLTCSDPALCCDKTNLVWKAVDLFRRKTGFTCSLRIHLEKHIPVQSGLGGGSSNAATTLWALNELHNHLVPIEELSRWAEEIGSDISFFFSLGSAYCTGKGGAVRNISPLVQKNPLWIIKPPEGLSTPLIFKHLKLDECSKQDPEELLLRWLQENPICLNDLEAPAFRVLPGLIALKESLQKEEESIVMMTGSGTGFFYLGQKTPQVHESCQVFRASFIARTKTGWY